MLIQERGVTFDSGGGGGGQRLALFEINILTLKILAPTVALVYLKINVPAELML